MYTDNVKLHSYQGGLDSDFLGTRGPLLSSTCLYKCFQPFLSPKISRIFLTLQDRFTNFKADPRSGFKCNTVSVIKLFARDNIWNAGQIVKKNRELQK